MKTVTIALIFICSAALAQNVVRARAKLIPNTGTFTATSEKAKGRLLKTKDGFLADRISVFVDSFRTENKLRDKHFMEHVAGGPKMKHPRIDLTDLVAAKGKGTASLTLNGVKKPVTMKYEDHEKFVDASFSISSKEFDLPKAQYLGIGVEDEITIYVKYFYEKK